MRRIKILNNLFMIQGMLLLILISPIAHAIWRPGDSRTLPETSQNKSKDKKQKVDTLEFLFKPSTRESQVIVQSLHKVGIKNTSQLRNLTKKEILSIRGIGIKTAEIIQKKLHTTRSGLLREIANKRKPIEDFLFEEEKTLEQQNIISNLRKAGIINMSQLKNLSGKELTRVSGIGANRIKIIQEALNISFFKFLRRTSNKCMKFFNKNTLTKS